MNEYSCFNTIVLTQYVLRKLICTGVQVSASCSTMANDYELIVDDELIVDYEIIVSIGKGRFQIN